MEDKLDSLSNSVKLMQEMLMGKGFAEENTHPKQSTTNGAEGKSMLSDQTSEVTIYKDAVKKA